MFVADYGQLSMHRLMLRDCVRTEAYREAILAAVRPGDVVLDVGAGTAIMSLLAVQAGAEKVYAVECASIARVARQVIARNAVEESIQVLEGKLESIELPEPVDVIVSEWMGCYGVDENLLAPVLLGRDRWLKSGGIMIPERVDAWMAPVWDSALHSDMGFWRSCPCGVDLSSIADGTAQEVLLGRHHVGEESLLAEPKRLWSTDAYECSVEEARLPFVASLSFSVTRQGQVSGLGAWFHADMRQGVVLTNAPGGAGTHWGRAVFPLEETIEVCAGTEIDVELTCAPAGAGYSHARWSVQVGERPWEHHDTRRDVTLFQNSVGRDA